MTLEKIFEKEIQKINNKAKIKKDIVCYFCDLINSKYGEFSNVFSQIIEKEFKENLKYLNDELEKKGFSLVKLDFFENTLYYKVSNMILSLSEDARFNLRSKTYTKKTKTPEIELNFAEYFRYNNCELFGKRLTKEGIKEIDSYRKVSKDFSIEEEKEIRIRNFERLCG